MIHRPNMASIAVLPVIASATVNFTVQSGNIGAQLADGSLNKGLL
jgi:hypothetical protein